MFDPKSPVTAIVPAYNEAPTIGPVVATLVDSGLFRDVIVISDGSTDATEETAKAAGASLVHQFPWKRGKGAAMQHGVSHSDTPLIFFCDADLIGLRIDHLKTLINPVSNGLLSMCVGLRDRGPLFFWLGRYMPLIGGERVLSREIFESIPDRYLHGFMVEAALNVYCRSHGLKVGTRPLRGLHIRRKMQKVGVWRGLLEYLSMWRQIVGAYVVTWRGRLRKEF